MAINVGQANFANILPNSNTYSTSLVAGAADTHSQLSGADGFLYVEIAISGTYTVTGVEWGGFSMDLLDVNYASNINIRHYRYFLKSPATGRKKLTVNFNTTYVTTFVWVAQSFTNCGGINDHDWDGLALTPHVQTPTVGANDLVYLSGLSQRPIAHLKLDGVDYYYPSVLAHGNIEADQYVGQITGNLSPGTISVMTDAGASWTGYKVTNSWVKFSEAGGEPPEGSAEGSWWLLMR